MCEPLADRGRLLPHLLTGGMADTLTCSVSHGNIAYNSSGITAAITTTMCTCSISAGSETEYMSESLVLAVPPMYPLLRVSSFVRGW